MNVEICNDPVRWDAFVEAQPTACNYHRWCWKEVIEKTFGHKGYYLAAISGNTIEGILPLVAIKSRFFGHFLVSIPFFSYGGLLTQNAEAHRALLQRTLQLAVELNVDHVEIRQGDPSDIEWQDPVPKVAMGLSLPQDKDEMWKTLSSRLRNKIRNAEKAGFTVRIGGSEDLCHFYPIFAINMRNVGTPVYSKKFFDNQFRTSKANIRVLTLWTNKSPIAGAILTPFRESLEMPWCASLPEWRGEYSHDYLYWSILKWSIQNGYKRVDFGRCTPGGGNYRFKQHWGCEERPLHWYFWVRPGRSIPHLRPNNPHYHLAVELWKRLPLFLANSVGPLVVRSIP
jgi:serine/alanine adding enzyme